ncbi:uncharacterized protein [Montipora capricornis]|uniref:uncharacterized protein n=1 Tax=Montipora capricornis TaxID=246305 RepID=UPI0035F21C82
MANLQFYLFALFVAYAESSYVFSNTISFEGGIYNTSYNFNASSDTFEFLVEVRATGWVGFGFARNAPSGMTNYDVAVGGVLNGAGYLKDYLTQTTEPPPLDSQQDWNLTSATEQDGVTTLKFSRLRDTNDSMDIAIEEGMPIFLIWAFHTTNDADGSRSLTKHTSEGYHRVILIPAATSSVLPAAATSSPTMAAMVSPTSTGVSTPETPTLEAASSLKSVAVAMNSSMMHALNTSPLSAMSAMHPKTPYSVAPTITASSVAVGASSAVSPSSAPPVTSDFISLHGGKYNVSWMFNSSMGTLHFTVKVRATGWIGFGLAAQAPNNMVGYDVAVGGVANGAGYLKEAPAPACKRRLRFRSCQIGSTSCHSIADLSTVGDLEIAHKGHGIPDADWLIHIVKLNSFFICLCQDYFTSGFAAPSEDWQQDWRPSYFREEQGVTTLKFYRKRDTNDTQKDIAIQPGQSYYFIWAYHSSDEVQNDSFPKHSYSGSHQVGQLIPGVQPATTPIATSTTAPTTGTKFNDLMMTMIPFLFLASPTKFPFSLAFDDNQFLVLWRFDDQADKVYYHLRVKTTGWIGFGFAALAPNDMMDYDVIVGGFSNGQGYLSDYKTFGKRRPTLDASQDYALLNASEVGGYTELMFERPRDTKDNNDFAFWPGGEAFIIWSYSTEDVVNENNFRIHSRRGWSTNKFVLVAKEQPIPTKPGKASALLTSIFVALGTALLTIMLM